jgi:hypothetical protein
MAGLVGGSTTTGGRFGFEGFEGFDGFDGVPVIPLPGVLLLESEVTAPEHPEAATTNNAASCFRMVI